MCSNVVLGIIIGPECENIDILGIGITSEDMCILYMQVHRNLLQNLKSFHEVAASSWIVTSYVEQPATEIFSEVVFSATCATIKWNGKLCVSYVKK